jgi:hypothetical protein
MLPPPSLELGRATVRPLRDLGAVVGCTEAVRETPLVNGGGVRPHMPERPRLVAYP